MRYKGTRSNFVDLKSRVSDLGRMPLKAAETANSLRTSTCIGPSQNVKCVHETLVQSIKTW